MIILDVGVNQTREEMMADFVNGTEPPLLYLEKPENYPLMVITALLLSLSAIIGTLGNLLVGAQILTQNPKELFPTYHFRLLERYVWSE